MIKTENCHQTVNAHTIPILLCLSDQQQLKHSMVMRSWQLHKHIKQLFSITTHNLWLHQTDYKLPIIPRSITVQNTNHKWNFKACNHHLSAPKTIIDTLQYLTTTKYNNNIQFNNPEQVWNWGALEELAICQTGCTKKYL